MAVLRKPYGCSRSSERLRAARAGAAAGGARAFRQFCTPSLSRHRVEDHDTLVERSRFHLRAARKEARQTSVGLVYTYTMEPDGPPRASVLLVHGWTGEASFMSAFGDYLRRRGFRAILLDLPAHGRSAGRITSLMDCAQAVGEVAEAMGPVRFAVGHSIGAMASLVAGEGRPPMTLCTPFEAYVLVSMPDRFGDVTHDFGRGLRLSRAAQRDFERRLENIAVREISDFTGTNLLLATGKPSLLIHSRDDDVVPFEDGERMVARCGNAELYACDGLGHRLILYAPPPVRAAGAFLLAQM
jgi:pimeloyl-ACP methyl ester carboxylesterase